MIFLLVNGSDLIPSREVGFCFALSSLALVLFFLSTILNNVTRLKGVRKEFFLGFSLAMIMTSMIAGYFIPILPQVDEHSMLIQALCGLSLFIMAGIDFLDYGYVLRMRNK